MHITGSFRIGRDAELRRTQSGESVVSLSLAAPYGMKDASGNRPTQWLEASLWGKRAETLAGYLLKGGQVYAVLGDPHIETYEGRNGPGQKLVARVLDIELTSSRQQGTEPRQQAPQPAPRPQAQKPAPADMDDDIPF